MILRRRSTPSLQLFATTFSVFFVALIAAQSDAPFDCHLTVDSFKFDLTTTSGEHTLSRTRETPPTSMVDSVKFNLCDDLKQQSDISDGDQVRLVTPFTAVVGLTAHLHQKSVRLAQERA